MSLLLPTYQLLQTSAVKESIPSSLEANLPKEMVDLERATRLFTAQSHWELSTTITSNHLLAIIAIANTLMSMNNASFVAEQERNRKLQRYLHFFFYGSIGIFNLIVFSLYYDNFLYMNPCSCTS